MSRVKKAYRVLNLCLLILLMLTISVYAGGNEPTTGTGENMWTVANRIIVDVYNHIAGLSTVLAGLMSAVAVIGAKLSNNLHKVEQAWEWLKRIWASWAIINGIGAFLAYIRPLFDGLATIS